MIAKIIWTLGFLIGTTTHALDLIYLGWLPYDFRPLPWNIYWTSLTLLDPLAAVAIWVRERSGILLGTAIMASNIAVNGYTLAIGYDAFLVPWLLQSAFGGFVFFTAWRHWRVKRAALWQVADSGSGK